MLHCKVIFHGRWHQLNFTKTCIRMECAFLLILKCMLRITLFICDTILKQCHRVGVMSLPRSFYSAYLLEETCLHNSSGTSLLAMFLSGVLLRCFWHQWGSLCFMTWQQFLTVVLLWPFSPSCLCSRQVVGMIGDRYS